MSLQPLAVIPARWASTRFPGKPLALLGGRPLVVHVLEACRRAHAFSDVVVATDDPRIEAAVHAAGGRTERTASTHPSGTDRVAEVAARMSLAADAVVVNVQGDEPFVAPGALRALADAFSDRDVTMATLVRPLADDERARPHVVKVVLSSNGDALYFSRADIPVSRDGAPVERWAHLGTYGYRRATLERLSALPPSPLERAESLEQLRALEHGLRIRCVRTTAPSLGVDTPEDLARAEDWLRARAVDGGAGAT